MGQARSCESSRAQELCILPKQIPWAEKTYTTCTTETNWSQIMVLTFTHNQNRSFQDSKLEYRHTLAKIEITFFSIKLLAAKLLRPKYSSKVISKLSPLPHLPSPHIFLGVDLKDYYHLLMSSTLSSKGYVGRIYCVQNISQRLSLNFPLSPIHCPIFLFSL